VARELAPDPSVPALEAAAPVFIGGCPRSGTTMLGALLGNHPHAICLPESLFKMDLFQLFARKPNPSHNEIRRTLKASLTANITRLSHAPDHAGDAPQRMRKYLLWYGQEHLKGQDVAQVRYWIDHTPHNLHLAAELLELFPNARFVHIIRDGRAVAASMKRVHWGPKTAIAVVPVWTKEVAIGLATEERLGDRVTRVKYEDLVGDTEATLRQLCGFLGWHFEDAMCVSSSYRVPEAYRGQHALVGGAPRRERAQAWKRELTAREVEIFEAYASSLLKHFGYEPENAAPRPPGFAEKAVLAVEEIARRAAGRLRLAVVRREARRRSRESLDGR
jgi:hypothetical protein